MAIMKVRYKGKGSSVSLINNKVYEVIAIEKNSYRIVDESGEDYLYHKDNFETVDETKREGEAPSLP